MKKFLATIIIGFVFVAGYITLFGLSIQKPLNERITALERKNITLQTNLDEANQKNTSFQDSLSILANQNSALQANLATARQGSIAGYALFDWGAIGQLGSEDTPAEGLVIQLYKLGDVLPDGGRNGELIAEVKVNSHGEYSFKATPGDYFVIPVTTIPGYPGWDSWRMLKGNILAVSEGSVNLGPTILIQSFWQQGKG